LLTELLAWGEDDPNIVGIAILRARAHGGVGAEPDLVIVLQEAALSGAGWVERFGAAVNIKDEDSAAMQVARVRCADGTEMNFLLTKPAHVGIEADDVREGLFSIVYDPHLLLTTLVQLAARPESD
jgi:hypothetical protein